MKSTHFTNAPHKFIAINHVWSVCSCLLSTDHISQFQTEMMLQNQNKLERGPMPNVMATLPNIGGALCSRPQSLTDAHY